MREEVEIFGGKWDKAFWCPRFMETSRDDVTWLACVITEASVLLNYDYHHKCTFYASCVKWDEIKVIYDVNSVTPNHIGDSWTIVSLPRKHSSPLVQCVYWAFDDLTSDLAVQTEVALPKKLVSDLQPHTKVTQVRFGKICHLKKWSRGQKLKTLFESCLAAVWP